MVVSGWEERKMDWENKGMYRGFAIFVTKRSDGKHLAKVVLASPEISTGDHAVPGEFNSQEAAVEAVERFIEDWHL